MAEYLNALGHFDITIVDNDSTYEPTLEWYKTSSFRTLYLGENYGHNCVWGKDIAQAEVGLDEFFIVTDPDLEIWTMPPNFLDYLLKAFELNSEIIKAGPSLRIDDLPDYFPLKSGIMESESIFWREQLIPDYYMAPIDTTFALYKHDRIQGRYGGHHAIRVAGDCTVRHLPFYLDRNNLSDEMKNYFATCRQDISTMSRVFS